jgi:fructose-1,6-bisphosphatase/inositol monophosphatase family enzyme
MSVTVTYTWPVSGITAPTLAQMQNFNAVVAEIAATADGDTTAVVTHNFNLSAADLAALFPFVKMVQAGATAILSGWYLNLAAATADSLTFTKATTGGSGAAGTQLVVQLTRPHTIER